MLRTHSDRDRYQYDIFQRYEYLGRALTKTFESQMNGRPIRVLDVGSGPSSLNEVFLPSWFEVIRADVSQFDDPLIVLITPGQPLPFADNEFDVVMAIEVLEHVPFEGRDFLIQECVRVASQIAAFSFPRQSIHVERAETTLNSAFRVAFGNENNFLKEHAEMGLPDPAAIGATLGRLGVAYAKTVSSPLSRWLLCSILDVFYCAEFGDGAEKGEFNRQMNCLAESSEDSEEHYRACFFAIKNRELDQAVRHALVKHPAKTVAAAESDWQLLIAEKIIEFFAKSHDSSTRRSNQLLDIKEQNISLLRDAIEAKDRKIAELNEDLQGSQHQLESARQVLRQMENHLAETAAQLVEAADQLVEKEAEVADQSARLAAFVAQSAIQCREISIHKQVILASQRQNESLRIASASQLYSTRALTAQIQQLESHKKQLERLLDARIRQLDRLSTSYSWRLTRPVRAVYRFFRAIRRELRRPRQHGARTRSRSLIRLTGLRIFRDRLWSQTQKIRIVRRKTSP